MVRLLADMSGLSSAFRSAATTGASVSKGLHDAMTPALAALNQTGVLGPFNEALAGVGQTIQTVAEHIHDLPLALAGIGAGVAGIGTGLSVLGSKDQTAHAQLQSAVAATGKSYSDYSDQIEAAIKHQEHFGNTAAQTQDALSALTEATGDPAKALQLLNTATDLAAAKHISLTSAAGQMAKAYNGSTKVFKEFGIQVTTTTKVASEMAKAQGEVARADTASDKAKQHLSDVMLELSGKTKLSVSDHLRLRDAQDAVTKAAQGQSQAHLDLQKAQQDSKDATLANGKAMDILASKLKGQAADAADTFTGKLKSIKATIEDQVSTIGQKYGPALQGAGAAMAGLGAAMKIGQTAMEMAKAAALGTRIELAALSLWEKITAAATFLLDAAMDANPLVLIALAVVALVAVIILLVTHVKIVRDAFLDLWKWIKAAWNGIWDAILFVWNWIKKNWPLLLGILTGPIGLAVALIYKYWDQIKKDAKAVIDYIVSIWNGLVAFFTGIPGDIWRILTGMWGFVSTEWSNMWTAVQKAWSGIWNWITGIPGAIGRALGGMWGIISSAWGSAWGAIGRAWSTTWGWITGLPAAIGRALGHMWDPMGNAFKAAINWVIGIWDSLHFKIGGWGIGPVHVPTVTVGMPYIPKLAQGGLITREGLVYVHAGEAVTPAPTLGRNGPVVHIDNAHFKETLDVEAFMRRVAWVASARAM
jgi:hypothetical protein